MKPLSAKEAKKILGEVGDAYTDREIEQLLEDLATIAKLYIQSVPKT